MKTYIISILLTLLYGVVSISAFVNLLDYVLNAETWKFYLIGGLSINGLLLLFYLAYSVMVDILLMDHVRGHLGAIVFGLLARGCHLCIVIWMWFLPNEYGFWKIMQLLLVLFTFIVWDTFYINKVESAIRNPFHRNDLGL